MSDIKPVPDMQNNPNLPLNLRGASPQVAQKAPAAETTEAGPTEAADAAQTHPNLPELNMAAIFALPELERGKTVRRVFQTPHGPLPVVLSADGEKDPEAFFGAVSALIEGRINPQPITFSLPDPQGGTGETITLTEPKYCSSLHLIAAVAVSPARTAEEWAIIGKKLGGKLISEVSGWAIGLLGLAIEEVQDKEKSAKN